jgi:hypothetical protein
MLVVFPGDGDDMMSMTKRTPNSQVISKRRKHPNLYNTDNTGPRKTRTHSLIDTREVGERFPPEGCRPHFTATNNIRRVKRVGHKLEAAPAVC